MYPKELTFFMLKTQSIVIFSQLEYYHGHIFMWVYFWHLRFLKILVNINQCSSAFFTHQVAYVANLMTWHVYVFVGSWLYNMLQITGSRLIPGHSDLFQHTPLCNAQSYLQHVPITNICPKLPLSGSNQNCPFLCADFSRRCLGQ